MTDRLRIAVPLLLASLITLPSCRGAQGNAPEVRVGVLANFTNEFAATSGRATMYAAQLAARAVNESGGLNVDGTHYRMTLVFKDFADRADAASTAARSLINQDEVDVIIGPQFSRHAVPVAVLSDNANVPMISPMSSNPLTTVDKSYVFRLASLDQVQAGSMARFAHQALGARRAAMLFNVASKYSRNLSEKFEAAFERAGGEVVARETYTTDDASDFRSALQRIKSSNADVLWLPNWTRHVVPQIRQARELSLDIAFLGSDTWDISVIGPMDESRGAYVAHQWHHELANGATREFVDYYRDTYRESPGVTAAMTYDAFGILVDAIERQNEISSESIRRGLSQSHVFNGVTGAIRYDGSGDPSRASVIVRIEEGEAVLHEIVDPEAE